MSLPRVIFLGGPTAAGKTELAIALAERLGGEIVNADSVQLYRRFDIGSAKASADERRRARHHLLDILEPNEVYSAARFVEDADRAIADIFERGATPIVAGGTGLYLRSLLHGLFDAPHDAEVRAELRARAEAGEGDALHAELDRVDPSAATRIERTDLVRVVRALEVFRASGRPISEWQAEHGLREARYRGLVITATRRRAALEDRIRVRVGAMLDAGLVDEVRSLREDGVSPAAPPMRTVGYREVNRCLDDELPEPQLAETIRIATRRFAKRQLTWFRGQWTSRWIDAGDPAERSAAISAAESFVADGSISAFGAAHDAHLRG